jgi:hypothetical protein
MAKGTLMWTLRLVFGALVAVAVVFGASAQDAKSVLKAMTDYVGSQKGLSLSFDADIEIITPAIQKLQFSASGKVDLSRPDKVRVVRTGGYADVELVADGKMLTVFARHAGLFAQVPVVGAVEQLIERLRGDYGLEMPGADLLPPNAFDVLMEDVVEGEHIGRGVVDGIECEHLAFRNRETDWQIWIEVGAKPIPRKYVITSKAVAAAPQYTLRIKDWRADLQFPAEAFVFQPPAGARKVEVVDLGHMDEVPAGESAGGSK